MGKLISTPKVEGAAGRAARGDAVLGTAVLSTAVASAVVRHADAIGAAVVGADAVDAAAIGAEVLGARELGAEEPEWMRKAGAVAATGGQLFRKRMLLFSARSEHRTPVSAAMAVKRRQPMHIRGDGIRM